LNQLITFLDKGGAKEGLRGGVDKDPLRSVRAKREADETGKGNFPSSTCGRLIPDRCSISKCCALVRNSPTKPREDGASRVPRRCPLASGVQIVDLTPCKSLETFIGESSETIKKVMSRYADNLAWVKVTASNFHV